MTRWLAITSACVLLCANVDAHAKANRFLRKAKKAYENLEYTRVTPLLYKALKQAKKEKNDADKIEIYFLLGTMHAIYSRDKQAAEAFAEVLELNPNFELPPNTSPKIRTAFGDAREAVGTTDVVVDAEPEPAPPDPDDADEPPSEDEDGGETIEAAPVDEGDELPAGLFGPTDDGMPGLSTRRSRGSPWYKKWWVWTIVGVAVAGGTGYLVYSLNQVDYPDRDFGPIPLR